MRAAIGFLGCLLTLNIMAGEASREINLQGQWMFITGDNMNYAAENFDDSHWKKIMVPGKWEDQGYRDYDGYAWYRLRIIIPVSLKKEGVLLRLGKIDDVDMVFMNGQFLQGRGNFPPQYFSAFNWDRQYLIPADMIHFGKENVIAVRIYDEWGDGGIISGPVGIYSQNIIEMAVDLSGDWLFKPGDQAEFADPSYNDRAWSKIRVPGTWESQSYADLDGFAWYRRHVVIPSSIKEDKVILVLGRIDDSDEVFVNGVRIARTGNFPAGSESFYSNTWQQERFYYIPKHIIHWQASNLIAIRVYDKEGSGGIYEGPVGIARQSALIQYKSRSSN